MLGWSILDSVNLKLGPLLSCLAVASHLLDTSITVSVLYLI
jgi:hypothetical protein